MSAFLFQKLLSGTLDAFDGFLYILPQDEAILHAGKQADIDGFLVGGKCRRKSAECVAAKMPI